MVRSVWGRVDRAGYRPGTPKFRMALLRAVSHSYPHPSQYLLGTLASLIGSPIRIRSTATFRSVLTAENRRRPSPKLDTPM